MCTGLFVAKSVASDYGTTGLIDIPTARMQQDGTFSANLSRDNLFESYAITYQAFEWLEGTFRYTGAHDFFYWDRNYEIKIKLLDETQYVPALSIGIRDLVGTGIFGSEYIVANKAWNNIDVTLGLGWGRLADDRIGSNPLADLSDQFVARETSFGLGGTVSVGDFFSGPDIGVFAGVKYRLTDWPLSLQIEYNPDQDRWERPNAGYAPVKSPISYGAIWHLADNIDIRFSHKHLDNIGVGIQVKLDTKQNVVKHTSPVFESALDMEVGSLPAGLNVNSWYDMFLYDIERSDLFVKQAKLFPTQRKAQIEILNEAYPHWPDAVDKAHALASLHLPNYITQVEYLVNEQGHVLHTVNLPRQRNALTKPITVAEFGKLLPGRMMQNPQNTTNFVRDKVFVDATITNRFMLFDPDNPFAVQLYAQLASKIDLPKEWKIRASYRLDLWNNFSGLTRESNSILPKVRSDALKYLQQGQSGLENLFLEKRGTFAVESKLHYRVFGGVLEDMYSGAGGELLYQPSGSRLAFGVSGAYVQQREFDGKLGLRDYKVWSGHASVYWATPFANYDVALHAGRYLAKDVGATLEVRRTFDNGWQLGLWATLTDVPFADFGEGSFDKGMYFRIPFDNILSSTKKSVYKTRIRPIQRDGGARLEGFSGEMWWDLRDARYDVFSQAGRHQ